MKKTIVIVICLISIFIIHGLVRSIVTLWEKKEVFSAAQEELVRVKEENRRLKQQQKIVQNPTFLEEQARNKLFLVKTGEKIVLLPSQTPQKEQIKKRQAVFPFMQWLQLFWTGGQKN